MNELHMPLDVNEIVVPEGRREVDPAVVKRLADSIEQVGLRHPITVRGQRGTDKYVLVAGLHRLEACKKLGRVHIPATIVTMTNAEARMWEIAENLHRSELTKLERSEQIEEWRKLGAQLAHPQSQHRGVKTTAEALGVSREEVQRSEKIANITPEAKRAAEAADLDDNQSVLLAVAKEAPEHQAAKVAEIASAKSAKRAEIPEPKEWSDVEAEQKRALMRAWNAASPSVKAWFRENVAEQPVMDRRFG